MREVACLFNYGEAIFQQSLSYIAQTIRNGLLTFWSRFSPYDYWNFLKGCYIWAYNIWGPSEMPQIVDNHRRQSSCYKSTKQMFISCITHTNIALCLFKTCCCTGCIHLPYKVTSMQCLKWCFWIWTKNRLKYFRTRKVTSGQKINQVFWEHLFLHPVHVHYLNSFL